VLCSSRTLRPTLPPKQCSDYQVEFGGEIRLACGSGPGIGTYHQQATFRKRPEIPAGQMSKLTAHTVAHHSASHSAAHDEADPGRLIVARPAEQVRGDQLPTRAAPAARRRRELGPPPHPRCRGEHRAVTPAPARPRRRRASAGQTLTRARPLRRRAARIARPARVRMRSRNPCVFARWRLFGWNVRLLTGTPVTGRVKRGTHRCASAPRGFQDMVNRGRQLPGQLTSYAPQPLRVKPPRVSRRALLITRPWQLGGPRPGGCHAPSRHRPSAQHTLFRYILVFCPARVTATAGG
jgi:hypothetical protein